jgi:hypothetical protein
MLTCTCPRRQALVLRAFDDAVVVYDEGPGDLHALEPLAAKALTMCLDGRPKTEAEIGFALFGATIDEECTELLRDWLRAFERLGWLVCNE